MVKLMSKNDIETIKGKGINKDMELDISLLTDLTDLHSHLLFDIDDGAKCIEDSIRLVDIYIENGYSGVVATPHYVKGTKYTPSPELLKERRQQVEKVFEEKGVKFSIYLGMEVRLEDGILEGLLEQRILSLNGGRYVLVEFPASEVPSYAFEMLFILQTEGYIPILAHPERNMGILADISVVQRLFDNGIIIQINKGSLLGEYGTQIKDTCIKLLQKGLVHIVATDTHREIDRNPSLHNLKNILIDLVGTENTELILKKNPKEVIRNNDLSPMKTFSISEKKRKANWRVIVASWLIGFTLIAFLGEFAFEKTVDYALEKFVGEEVLKDPVLSKKIKRLSVGIYGTKNKGDTVNNRDTENKGGTIDDRSGGIALDGKIINESQQYDISDIYHWDEESGSYIDLAMYESNQRNAGGSLDNKSYKFKEFYSDAVKHINITAKFTNADRTRVLRIIYAAVPRTEIRRLRAFDRDGLTSAEIEEIKATVRGYLSPGDYQELKLLYVKYENSRKIKKVK